MKRFFLMATAALALSGCDMIRGWLGLEDYNKNGSASSNRTREAGGGDGLISNLQPMDGAAPAQDQGTTGDQTEQGSEQQTPPDQTAPADGATGGITPSMIVGRWGDNGRCDQAIEFFANGTFRAANGGTGSWRLVGDRLTMFNGNRSITLRIRSITAQRVVAEDAQGSRGESVRC